MVSLLANRPDVTTEEDMRQFMEEIRRFPLLKPEEERELARRSASGDEDAIRQLVNANFGWADEVQSCHKWNKTSVPAPEDVPSLPKTGDASVIGYAAMAVLAACGLLKRR